MKRWRCGRCDWEGKSEDKVAVMYHLCREPKGHPLGGIIPLWAPPTIEASRAALWDGFAANQPGQAILERSEDELREETDARTSDALACPQGHSWTEENSGLQANGVRYCRACHRERERNRRRGG